MSELKPCPFCGGEAEIMSHPVYTYLKPYDPETADKKYYAQCKACATQCGVLEYDTPEEAKAAWEHRAEPDNEPLTLDELREMGETDWVWLTFPELTPEESGWYRAKRTYMIYSHEHYGKTWLAYRSKPKEAQDER